MVIEVEEGGFQESIEMEEAVPDSRPRRSRKRSICFLMLSENEEEERQLEHPTSSDKYEGECDIGMEEEQVVQQETEIDNSVE